MSFAHLLATWREREGLTQEKAAQALSGPNFKISRALYSLVEKGHRKPNDEFRRAFALAADVDPEATLDRVSRTEAEIRAALSRGELDEVSDDELRMWVAASPYLADRFLAAREAELAAEQAALLQETALQQVAIRQLGAQQSHEKVSEFVERASNYFDTLETHVDDWLGSEAGTSFDVTLGELFDPVLSTIVSQDAYYPHLLLALECLRDKSIPVEIESRATSAPLSGAGRWTAEQSPVVRIRPHWTIERRAFEVFARFSSIEFADSIDREIERGSMILDDPLAERIARTLLCNYAASAIMMPYYPFIRLAEESGYDIELLCEEFRVSVEQACHRIATLRNPERPGISFHMLKIDEAGNITKKIGGSGIGFAGFGGKCVRWNVFRTLGASEPHRVQVSTTRGSFNRPSQGDTYFCIAFPITRSRTGGVPRRHVIAIGCKLKDATALRYARGVDLSSVETVEIGIACETCARSLCSQRVAPFRLVQDASTTRSHEGENTTGGADS